MVPHPPNHPNYLSGGGVWKAAAVLSQLLQVEFHKWWLPTISVPPEWGLNTTLLEHWLNVG